MSEGELIGLLIATFFLALGLWGAVGRGAAARVIREIYWGDVDDDEATGDGDSGTPPGDPGR
jgi:hypothetical protein